MLHIGIKIRLESSCFVGIVNLLFRWDSGCVVLFLAHEIAIFTAINVRQSEGSGFLIILA